MTKASIQDKSCHVDEERKYFSYRANGLVISSEIQFPELHETTDSPNVFIRYGNVPEQLKNVVLKGLRYESSTTEYLMDVPGIAKYWIKNGSDMVVWPYPNVHEDAIRVIMLAPVFGALAHMNGFLPIHASAIEVNGKAVLFAGNSGTGKSTIASGFKERGYRVLADDISSISFGDNNIPMLNQGYKHLKVWYDTAEKLGLDTDNLRKVRPELEKYSLPLNCEFQDSIPVEKMYISQGFGSKSIEVIPLQSKDKIIALKHNTFRFRMVKAYSSIEKHFQKILSFSHHVPILTIDRPQEPFNLEALINKLEKDFS